MASKDYLAALQAAVKMKYGCKLNHRESVFVREKVGGQTVWMGNVEVFDLLDHEKSRICYAWPHITPDGEAKYISVLGSRAVDSAKKAVQAAVFVDAELLRKNFEE